MIVNIEVNDLLDELMAENKRLVNELLFANNCLNLLNELKSYLQIIHAKYKTMIAEEDVKQWQILEESVDTTVDEYHRCKQQIKSTLKSNVNQESRSDRQLLTSETSLTTADPQTITKQKSRQQRIQSANKPTNGLYVCRHNDCGKQFKTRIRFTKHMTVHFKQHKWPNNTCHVCDKTFKFNSFLATHMKTRDDNNNKHKTLSLNENNGNNDRQSDQSILLLLNRNNFDDKQQRYLCPFAECNRKYVFKSDLKKHYLLTHYKPDSKPFVCQICGQGFKRNCILKDHMAIHDVNRQKTYRCQYCDKCFFKSYALKVHQNFRHLLTKTFNCGINDCREMFVSTRQRSLHRQSVHQMTYALKRQPDRHSCQWPGCDYRCATTEQLVNHTRVHTGERPYACQWPECNKQFRTKAGYRRHDICHKNLKPFACQWPGCDYRGNSASNYYIHIKIHKRQQQSVNSDNKK
ncbi:zinc finger protein 510-like [Oppia nitens]|uniref:zinc finger protein 510-like n=1 Tax=Oppia nitens TaxID=1686743 RepID=UPI0023DB3A94|nr:zinc finger protein 510-like [Oppia nitens]